MDQNTQIKKTDYTDLDGSQKKEILKPQTAEQMEQAISNIVHQEEEEKVIQKAAKLGFDYVNLITYPLKPEILEIIPEELVKKYNLIAYTKSGKNVKVAALEPQNPEIQKALKILEDSSDFLFSLSLASKSSIDFAQKSYSLLVHHESKQSSVDISEKEGKQFASEIENLTQLKNKISQVATTKLVDIILAGAVKTQSSDIHIEVTETEVRIRYRIDGILQDVASFSSSVYHSVISRIKFLAKLKMDITNIPQDGKFFIKIGEKRIDIRVSSLPTVWGENVVMRLFDQEAVALNLDQLGLTDTNYQKVKKSITSPCGMTLVTGPTGSGKTTTLYAILQKLNRSERKIITLEDPIEYNLPGISQSQVNPKVDFDFATGLKSILRQDPDVLMIGEIRDYETADMAVHSALTGHIVLSTLHTIDAAGALPRLVDIGIKPFLVTDAINIVISQRLVRRICLKCKEEYQPSESIKKEIQERLAKFKIENSNFKLWRGKGCINCNNTGYRGRIGLFEVLEMSDEIEELVLNSATVSEINEKAVEQKMLTIEQDGLQKVLSGITTIDEIWRVVKE